MGSTPPHLHSLHGREEAESDGPQQSFSRRGDNSHLGPPSALPPSLNRGSAAWGTQRCPATQCQGTIPMPHPHCQPHKSSPDQRLLSSQLYPQSYQHKQVPLPIPTWPSTRTMMLNIKYQQRLPGFGVMARKLQEGAAVLPWPICPLESAI